MDQPPPCLVCKLRCATDLSSGMLFGIYFQTCFVPAAVTHYMNLLWQFFVFCFLAISPNAMCFFCFFTQIVPCKVRLEFNEIITKDTVIFDAPGGLHYGGPQRTKNIPDWRKWLESFRQPHASHWGWTYQLLLQKGNSKVGCYLHKQRRRWWPTWWSPLCKGIRLSEDESGNLWYILPPRDDYVGMPFVTRLTRTNVTAISWYATC